MPFRRISLAPLLAAVVALATLPRGGRAEIRTEIELQAAGYPSRSLAEGRLRFFPRYDVELGDRWYFRASGYFYGAAGSDGRSAHGIVRPHETYLERRTARSELRIGYSNVVWGVLDELQPTDVVNPLDLSRFVVQGRVEARLPVPLVRTRWFLPKEISIEALVVPFPRSGTFDQIEESSSPFFDGPARGPLAAVERAELPRTARNAELGGRVRGTFSGVDWGVSVYRDVVDFDVVEVAALPGTTPRFTARRPSRWMVGSQLETLAGLWTLRAEGALYLSDPVQSVAPPGVVETTSFQGGLAADRRMGPTFFSVGGLYRAVPARAGVVVEDELTLTGLWSRDLARGTRSLRLFGVWNLLEETAFLRAIASIEIVENLRGEAAAGAFLGESSGVFGLLGDSDFASFLLKWYF